MFNIANNAKTELVAGMTDTDTTMEVSDASILPEIPFRVTIWSLGISSNPGQDPAMEIVEVTGVNSNVLTIERGKEGTAPTSHSTGNTAAVLVTAGIFNDTSKGITSDLQKLDDKIIYSVTQPVENNSTDIWIKPWN
jgi:hypothetical protein